MTALHPSVYHPRPVKLSRESQCDGKKRHLNIHHATMALTNAQNNGDLCTYKCPHCGFWHLGHKRSRRPEVKKFEVVTLPRNKLLKGD